MNCPTTNLWGFNCVSPSRLKSGAISLGFRGRRLIKFFFILLCFKPPGIPFNPWLVDLGACFGISLGIAFRSGPCFYFLFVPVPKYHNLCAIIENWIHLPFSRICPVISVIGAETTFVGRRCNRFLGLRKGSIGLGFRGRRLIKFFFILLCFKPPSIPFYP